jgi:hypothetical protein
MTRPTLFFLKESHAKTSLNIKCLKNYGLTIRFETEADSWDFLGLLEC